jgi:hypothetical protein
LATIAASSLMAQVQQRASYRLTEAVFNSGGSSENGATTQSATD